MVAVLLIATSLVAVARPAQACSCAGVSMDEAVFGAEVLFIGTPVDNDIANNERRVRFEVHEQLTGNLDPTVSVFTWGPNDSCGEPAWAGRDGMRAPLEPVVVQAYWTDGRMFDGSVCSPNPSVAELDALLEGDLPPTEGSGPVAGLVWSQQRWAGLTAFDAKGRVLSRGLPSVWLMYAHQCVDHLDHVVEVSWDEVALRDLNTMQVVARQSIPIADQGPEIGARCNPGAEVPLKLVPLADLGVTASSPDPVDVGSVTLQAIPDPEQWMPGFEATDGVSSQLIFEQVNLNRLQILGIDNGPDVEPAPLDRPTLRPVGEGENDIPAEPETDDEEVVEEPDDEEPDTDEPDTDMPETDSDENAVGASNGNDDGSSLVTVTNLAVAALLVAGLGVVLMLARRSR